MHSEQYSIICQKLKEIDSKATATIVQLATLNKKVDRISDQLAKRRANKAQELRSLRQQLIEQTAQTMTLKQELNEILKFQ